MIAIVLLLKGQQEKMTLRMDFCILGLREGGNQKQPLN